MAITATGGTKTTSGDWQVHVFNAGGDFEVTDGSGTVEYLIVAGGGGGGSRGPSAGGGGAGGFRTNVGGVRVAVASDGGSLSDGVYPVVVGDGGGGGSNDAAEQGSDGGDSSAVGVTSTGGGGGGSAGNAPDSTGRTGGSGGGGGTASTDTEGTGAAGTSGQGNTGGNSEWGDSNDRAGGGGGGSGGAGSNGELVEPGTPQSGTGGAGGVGTSNSITGSAVTYAAGGQGGGETSPGAGAAHASANTGDGGSGSAEGAPVPGTEAGRNGGSGVVVIRYLTAGDPVTTAGPTTAAPSTVAPTTGGPTTAGPTSGPTTAGPTTAAPTTTAPTTGGPTTAGPSTGPPTTAVPGECIDEATLRSVLAEMLDARGVYAVTGAPGSGIPVAVNVTHVDDEPVDALTDPLEANMVQAQGRTVGDVGIGNTAHLLQSADTGVTEVARTGADAATIYTYFTDGVRADAFKATGFLTTLGANAPTDWINGAAVKADAVTKIQAGLSTYDGSDTAGTGLLLTRVLGTILAGNHAAQSGDSYAVVSSVTHGNAALKTLIDTVDGVADELNARLSAAWAGGVATATALATAKTAIDAIKVEVDKVPRQGESYRWTNTDTTVTGIVAISEAV